MSVENLKQEIESLGGNLIAASKTVAVDKIKNIYMKGVFDFGENYLSEALEKKRVLSDMNIKWHYLGRVQSGTLNKIVNQFYLIHTITKISHLKKINEKTKYKQKVLIQIRHSEDIRGYGILEKDLDDFVNETSRFKNIELMGLMFLPPEEMKGESLSEAFLWARRHFERVGSVLGGEAKSKWVVLSMGMSGDYLEALKNQATHVRLGRLIFGER